MVSTQAFAETAAARIAQIIEQAIAQHGRATVAFAGGTTPREVYRRLAQDHRLPWHKIEIFFGDERAVPPDDPQSNYRMVRESLLEAAAVPSENVHRIPAERPDGEAVSREYATCLPERLDLIILGIGVDGHTASLFPGAAAMHEHIRKVVAVEGSKPPHQRLTVTPPVIMAAANKIVLAIGSDKAEAVARALTGSDSMEDCPARLARDGIWIMDHAAASSLPHESG
ncbi:MAG: 6-phosphogluconolactonase [Sulfuricaulis sp.]